MQCVFTEGQAQNLLVEGFFVIKEPAKPAPTAYLAIPTKPLRLILPPSVI